MIYQSFIGEIKGVKVTRECYYRAMEEIINVFENEYKTDFSTDLTRLHLSAVEQAERKGIDPFEFKRDCISTIYKTESFNEYRFERVGFDNFYHNYNQALESTKVDHIKNEDSDFDLDL